MIVYYDQGRAEKEPRVFPYVAREAGHSDFIDFTKHPELIDTSLEDFKAHSNTSAVKTFYDFLRWVNGEESLLATCDCALRSPVEHKDTNSFHNLSVHGRVFILFRDLRFNTSSVQSDWLCGRMMKELEGVDSEFPATKGVVGFTKQPAIQTEISDGQWHGEHGFEIQENDPGVGHHLMLTFWGYGDSEEEAFGNLERVFKNIWVASRLISQLIRQSLGSLNDGAEQGS